MTQPSDPTPARKTAAMKTVVINNEKGGVGKTMIAVHMAWFFAEADARVLFIDLDVQRNASSVLARADDAPDDGSLPWQARVVGEAASLFDEGFEPPAPAGPGISIYVGSEALGTIDSRFESAAACLRTAIDALHPLFDFYIIDTPPTWGSKNFSALLIADYLIAPLQLEQFAMDGINSLLSSIASVEKARDTDLTFLGLLPSMFQSNSVIQKANLKNLVANLGGTDLLFPGVLTVRQGYVEAIHNRMPVWTSKKTAAVEAGREMKLVFKVIVDRMLEKTA